MDPLSITVSCVSLTTAIAKTSISVAKFVREVRGARSDLDAVSRELLSLKTVLDLLVEDVADGNDAFPDQLRKQITGIVTNCSGVVAEIEEVLTKHEGGKVTKAARWAMVGNEDVNKLRSSLEAHKSALEIALDMVALTLTREIKADTTELLQDTTAIKEQMTADTAQIIAEILRLQQQLPKDAGPDNANGFMLERYLDNLTSYAETVCDTYSDGVITPVARRSEDMKRPMGSSRSSWDGGTRSEDESMTLVASPTGSNVKEERASWPSNVDESMINSQPEHAPNRMIPPKSDGERGHKKPSLVKVEAEEHPIHSSSLLDRPERPDLDEDVPQRQQVHLASFSAPKANLKKDQKPSPSHPNGGLEGKASVKSFDPLPKRPKRPDLSENVFPRRPRDHANNSPTSNAPESNVDKEQNKRSLQIEWKDGTISYIPDPSNRPKGPENNEYNSPSSAKDMLWLNQVGISSNVPTSSPHSQVFDSYNAIPGIPPPARSQVRPSKSRGLERRIGKPIPSPPPKPSTRGRAVELRNATHAMPLSRYYQGLPSELRSGANKMKFSDEQISYPPKEDDKDEKLVLDYLQPGFDPASLTVPRLQTILIDHGIEYHSGDKRQLIKIFNDNFLVKARRPSTDSETDEDFVPQKTYTLANLPRTKYPSAGSTAQQTSSNLELALSDSRPSLSNITITCQCVPDFIWTRVPSTLSRRKFDAEFSLIKSFSLCCEPSQFKDSAFLLREAFPPSRETYIFFSIFVPSEQPASVSPLALTMKSLKRALDALVYRRRNVFSWESICVGICTDAILSDASAGYRSQLGITLDSASRTALDKTANIRLHVASIHLPFGDAASPMRLIILERCPTQVTWTETLPELLTPQFVIRLDAGMSVRPEKIYDLWENSFKYPLGVVYKESKIKGIVRGVRGLLT